MDRIINRIDELCFSTGFIVVNGKIRGSFISREKTNLNGMIVIPKGVYKETPIGFTILNENGEVLTKVKIVGTSFIHHWKSSSGEIYDIRDNGFGVCFMTDKGRKVALPSTFGSETLTAFFQDPVTEEKEEVNISVNLFEKVD